jgi:hypothetical protein
MTWVAHDEHAAWHVPQGHHVHEKDRRMRDRAVSVYCDCQDATSQFVVPLSPSYVSEGVAAEFLQAVGSDRCFGEC